ncbi:MAG TPA: hypothetical protein PK762_04330 [Candidatus Kapabacteria bacterium]|nr:hypothetical protein [Candidatus Kapabacteria bacterium]
MEIGSVILTQFVPKIIATFVIKYFSNIFPNWIVKKFPFEKDKIIVLIDMPIIYNRIDFKRINFSLSFRNFNYTNLVIEKIKIEILKDSSVIHEFERPFTETELQSTYQWNTDLTDSLIERYSKYFIQYPDLENFYTSVIIH